MKYYVMINGRQAGPFEEFQLIGNGVTRDTQVWHEGMPQWQPAGMVPELAHLFAGEQQLGNTTGGGNVPPIGGGVPNPGYNSTSGGFNQGGCNPPIPPCPKTYLVESILVTVLCCVPFGIVSIVNAAGVSSAYNTGNYKLALQKSENAKKWALVSLVVGLIGAICGFFVGLLGG